MSSIYKIEADTHCHSIASSHAYGTISENLSEAGKKGLLALAITDHGPALPDSPHPWHFYNMRVLPRFVNGVALIRGIEANIIDIYGNIDTNDENITKLEWIIASFHNSTFPVATKSIHTQALIAAANNEHVDLMGHMDSPDYPFDIREVVKACKENGKFVEMNNSSFVVRRGGQDMCLEIATECMDLGVPVVINSDAHCPWDIGEVSTMCNMLETISFPVELVLNAKVQNIFDHITKKHKVDFTYTNKS